MKTPCPSCACGNYGPPVLNRREMLRRGGMGFGTLALSWLLGEEGTLLGTEGEHVFPLKRNGKVKSVILLYMGGGPSHVDTWDPKPILQKLHGQDVPESLAKNVPTNKRLRVKNLYASPFEFERYGQSGIPVSWLFRATAQHVDDICVIRSMHHDSPIHAPAEYLTLTGSVIGTRPSLGSWLYYGLGSENQDLPGFIVMLEGDNFGGPAGYGAGFLSPRYQGTVVEASKGITDIQMPTGYTTENRRAQLNLMGKLSQRHQRNLISNSELEARILSYEMAFRMQTAAPEAFDLNQETEETRQLYGIDESPDYGKNCLLARRLVERGVRFVQLNQGGWDAHGDLKGNHEKQARLVDRPVAGLLTDLKRRGLLQQTLIIWGGEFGRTPTAEGSGDKPGRDHGPTGYTMWLAGGGVKGGQIIGATDEIGYTVVDRPVHPNDLQATILHALGIDQHELYYSHQNRKEIVTVLGGEVIKEVFA
ncbi:MAG: DUF1501 domain-containing protein [Acidobacteria bacterium]|nr:DUF1501 domain-containing protein [Acidobacteriota bacterium]